MNCNDCGGFLPRGCTCSPFGGRIAPSNPVVDSLRAAPEGTLAPAFNGGAWLKVGQGRWQWNGHAKLGKGSTFPRPGGDWTGDLIQPSVSSWDTPEGGA